MKTIIAIGGGKFGRDGEPYETQIIDEKIVSLTEKISPQVLFIPTASNDSEGYVELFQKNYGETLGCKVDVLRVYEKSDSIEEIEQKINIADVIYVGGGNTVTMLTMWKNLEIEKLLFKAYTKGTIIIGLSAGAICWFDNILSDFLKFETPDAPLSFLLGLNFLPLTLCPHYNSEPDRRPGFNNALKKTNLIGFGIDDNAALILQNEELSILKGKTDAHVWICFWNNDRYIESPLEPEDKFKIHDIIQIKKMILNGKMEK